MEKAGVPAVVDAVEIIDGIRKSAPVAKARGPAINRSARLDASYHMRKIIQMRRRYYPNGEDMLSLINEGLQAYGKQITMDDFRRIEDDLVGDLDAIGVYANLMGTSVILRGADRRPLVHIPHGANKRMLRKLFQRRTALRNILAIRREVNSSSVGMMVFNTFPAYKGYRSWVPLDDDRAVSTVLDIAEAALRRDIRRISQEMAAIGMAHQHMVLTGSHKEWDHFLNTPPPEEEKKMTKSMSVWGKEEDVVHSPSNAIEPCN